jgi:hypothetical protein
VENHSTENAEQGELAGAETYLSKKAYSGHEPRISLGLSYRTLPKFKSSDFKENIFLAKNNSDKFISHNKLVKSQKQISVSVTISIVIESYTWLIYLMSASNIRETQRAPLV